MAHNWSHGNLTFGNIDIIAMVNFPSGHALQLITQEMVTVASYIGKISTDKKYPMSISNSALYCISGILKLLAHR
jgi:hypothetical protein